MRFKFAFGALAFLCSMSAQAFVFPPGVAYVPKPEVVGSAIGDSIHKNLVKRGYAVHDPKVYKTIKEIADRATPSKLGAALGTTRILPLLARLTPWYTAGFIVYEGLNWYFDQEGKVIPAVDAVLLDFPGFTTSTMVWCAADVVGVCGPNEFAVILEKLKRDTVFSKMRNVVLSSTTIVAGDATYPAGRARKLYTFEAYRQDLDRWSGTSQMIGNRFAPVACPPGSMAIGTSCPAPLTQPGDFLDQPTKKTPEEAFESLPPLKKAEEMSPQAVASLADAAYRMAAADPAFAGLPYSAASPVTAAQAAEAATERKTVAPAPTLDMVANEPIPYDAPWINTGYTPTDAVPTVPPGEEADNAPIVKPDLGVDPGIKEPVLPEGPDFFKPVKDLIDPFFSFELPSHSSDCPTWSAYPTIAGKTFPIELNSHCALFDQHRQLIYQMALVGWLVLAFFIILSA